MAKFDFKLQPLLNVKSQQEDNAKNSLGKAIRALENEKIRLKNLESSKEGYISEFNTKTKKTTADKLVEYNRYISYLASGITHQKDNVNCASRNVDKIRGELIKISMERKILEKYKDKKYGTYLVEQTKDEQKLNDEIVSFRNNGHDMGDENA